MLFRSVVVHDHVVLAETAMFPWRAVVAASARQPIDEAHAPSDLTGGLDGGLVVELNDFDTVVLAPRERNGVPRPVHLKSFAVRPSRVAVAIAALNRL